jgi:polyhydroxyalkanoate synthesis repressor PhaR
VAPILVKKYGNRRLYDTTDSKYVTLDELAMKIRNGADVRVVDAQTDEDLTQSTLVQIVLEAGNGAKFLPVQLLTQMIRLSDDSLAEFFSRYVTGALEMYLQAKRGVQSIAGFSPFGQWPFAQAHNYGYAAAPMPEDVPPTDADRDKDISTMRRELDELKQAIREGLAAKAPARKKRKP